MKVKIEKIIKNLIKNVTNNLKMSEYITVTEIKLLLKFD